MGARSESVASAGHGGASCDAVSGSTSGGVRGDSSSALEDAAGAKESRLSLQSALSVQSVQPARLGSGSSCDPGGSSEKVEGDGRGDGRGDASPQGCPTPSDTKCELPASVAPTSATPTGVPTRSSEAWVGGESVVAASAPSADTAAATADASAVVALCTVAAALWPPTSASQPSKPPAEIAGASLPALADAP